jgi:hypothetical protein
MKRSIDLRKMFSPLALLLLFSLSLTGCGGDNNVSDSYIDNTDQSDNTGQSEHGLPLDISNSESVRISIAGSSVTWGSGGKIDDDSYPGYVVNSLRKNKATTYLPTDLQSNKKPEYIGGNEAYTYKKALYRFSGKNTSISGTLDGDKIFIAIAKQRGNIDAALIDLYIDDKLVKTFSTKNEKQYSENLSKQFIGDGKIRSWDLGMAHTFNHRVKIDGVTNTKGKINNLGYDGDWPDNFDWLIFRKVKDDEVHHFISFKNPPSNGSKINITFDAGENIKPIASTSENVELNIGSQIESLYGDRTTIDLTRPLKFYEGVDFRQTNDLAIISADMGDSRNHSFRLVIKGMDPSAKGNEPALYLNYVTNKMFFMQNASIGGFTAKDFLKESGTTNYKKINQYNPDIVILESGTNDDWEVNEWLAWKDVHMTADQVRNDITSAINLQKLQKKGNQYLVGLTYIDIKNAETNSISLDPQATYRNDIKAGDILVIGDFKGDNRRLAVRIISSWDANNKVAYFDQPLHSDDYVGDICQIKRIDKWVTDVKNFIHKIKAHNNKVKIGLITGGIPNMNARRLEGYREKAQEIAKSENVTFIDIYQATYNFTYNREPNKQLFLNKNASTTSTGAKSYTLYLDNGKPLEVMLARNFKVYVDGKELTLRDFYVDGGLVKTWPKDEVAEPLYLENAKWIIKPSKLVFEKNKIPAAGSNIEVYYNDNDEYKWSQDDTHLGTNGYKIFSETIIKTLFQ